MLSDTDLKQQFRTWFPKNAGETRLILAPMRVCPLGAHSDHQLGNVVGFALNKGVRLVFSPRRDDQINLRSLNFDGEQTFHINDCEKRKTGNWDDYCAGAVLKLQSRYDTKFGIDALVCSDLPSGGLGSSGAVGVAYLSALAQANHLTLAPYELIELDRRIENDYLGVDNGIIDQAITVLGESSRLIEVNCRELTHQSFGFNEKSISETSAKASLIIAYSGIAKQLTQTGFNNRVHECREAAGQLLRLAQVKTETQNNVSGDIPGSVLGDVPMDIYKEYEKQLPRNLRNRARHFFTEASRVAQSVELWQRGDLHGFGELMQQSGKSSVHDYESGAREIVDLYEVMNQVTGVLGARFGGGGYRGSGFALIETDEESEIERISQEILDRYLKRQPDMRELASVHHCEIGDGAAALMQQAKACSFA